MNEFKTFFGILLFIFGFIVPLPANEIQVRDTYAGAIVWRPYQSRVEWTGSQDGEGFASGYGTLRIYAKDEAKLLMEISGTMERGVIKSHVQAHYPQSPDRAFYAGDYTNWSENGHGTMLYKDGKRQAGLWKDGELVRRTDLAPSANQATTNQAPATSAPTTPSTTAPAKPSPVSSIVGSNPVVEAETKLREEFDRLKKALAPEAGSHLVETQSAWIHYRNLSVSMAQAYTGSANEESKERVYVLLTHQRAGEIRAVAAWLIDGDRSGFGTEKLDEAGTQKLEAFLSEVGSSPKVNADDLEEAIQYWNQAVAISALIPLRNSTDPSTADLEAYFFAASAFRLEYALRIWFGWKTSGSEGLSQGSPAPTQAAAPQPSSPAPAQSSQPEKKPSGELNDDAALFFLEVFGGSGGGGGGGGGSDANESRSTRSLRIPKASESSEAPASPPASERP